MKKILYIALIISIVTYSFWGYFPKGFFYYGNAIVFLMLCMYLFLKDKKSFVCFVFLCFSISNLLDELFFNPGIFQINEYVFALITPLIWLLKNKIYAGENTSK